MAIIWITHDLGVVAGLAQRVVVMYGGYIIEEAAVKDLYANPSHPYTLGLLGSLPHDGRTGTRPAYSPLKGMPPVLYQKPQSCPFAPRCIYVQWNTAGMRIRTLETVGPRASCGLLGGYQDREEALMINNNEVLLRVENLKMHFPIYRGRDSSARSGLSTRWMASLLMSTRAKRLVWWANPAAANPPRAEPSCSSTSRPPAMSISRMWTWSN